MTDEVPSRPSRRPSGSHISLVTLGLLVFLADQLSKGWAQRLPEQLPYTVVPHVVQVLHVENPGIAFSLFSDAGALWRMGLVSASALVLLGVTWLVLQRPVPRTATAGLAMILGGAGGNLMDRLLFGRVTDFLQISVGRYDGPIFNVADVAITVGATALMWAILRERASVEVEPVSVAGEARTC